MVSETRGDERSDQAGGGTGADGAGTADGSGGGTVAAETAPADGSRGGTATDEAGTADGSDGGSGPVADHPLPPGPDGYPLLGSALPFARDPFAFYDTLAEYGDVVRWRVPGITFTSLLHPDHVEQVLVADHDRFDRNVLGDFGVDFAPEGLFSTAGEQWRSQRRTMQPAFTVERIRTYADTMARSAERAAERWTDGEAVALNRAFSKLTLRILARALFDLEVDPDADGTIPRAARAMNDRLDVQGLSSLLPLWLPTPTNRRYRRAMADYRERIDGLIDRRLAAGTDGDDLLSMLLAARGPGGDGLSESAVRDNLITFTFAGHETTALGLTYAVLELAKHDDVAGRLREEVASVVGDGTPGAGDVPDLTYTDRVVKETLRLHPPAHIVVRRAAEDAVVGGYRVPEGTILTLPQFRLHTDERFWADPEAFWPDRWAEEPDGAAGGNPDGTASGAGVDGERPTRRVDRPEYAYFPFGAGPRHCIGMRFATLELQLVVAVLAREFEFELLSDPDPAVSAGGTHRPKADVRVRVHRRDGSAPSGADE